MKILLTFAFLLFFLLPLQAKDGDKVRVKLKIGTTIVGELKSLDPMKQIVLNIAGQESTFLMSDIENIEMVQDTPTLSNHSVDISSLANSNVQLGYKKLMVTDEESYPARITITIDNNPHEMILVPGGRMNMGYDGDGSLSMKSEPVHEVAVTSFYISTQPLPASFVTSVVGVKKVNGEGIEPAEVRDFALVERVVKHIVQQTGRNLRLPTEAEWEYASCSEQQNAIFEIARGAKTAYEWCGDFWAQFDNLGIVVDPKGPFSGNQHVIRAYNARRGKFDRSNEVSGRCYQGLVRLAIKAKDIQ